MDPEFLRPLSFVLIGGGAVCAIATVVLVLIFRRFGGAKPGSSSHFGLIAALVGFVFLCCLALFALSYTADR
jgi:multisubunit Na+/H+ antiporter MnhB subunit